MPIDPAPSHDLRCLGYADHLLIWSLRSCLMGRWPCAMLEREYRDACGPAAAADARSALRAFARGLETQTRRAIVLSPPGGVAVTDDEQRLVAVFAAAQDGDRARGEPDLRRLLGGPANPYLFDFARVVGQALLARGHRFGAPPIELSASRRGRAVATGAAA
jgi:hypothetical protein